MNQEEFLELYNRLLSGRKASKKDILGVVWYCAFGQGPMTSDDEYDETFEEFVDCSKPYWVDTLLDIIQKPLTHPYPYPYHTEKSAKTLHDSAVFFLACVLQRYPEQLSSIAPLLEKEQFYNDAARILQFNHTKETLPFIERLVNICESLDDLNLKVLYHILIRAGVKKEDELFQRYMKVLRSRIPQSSLLKDFAEEKQFLA